MSILIPAYRATYLVQALASVFTQGFTDYEVIISDDSTGDEVWTVVQRFSDSRIDYVRTVGRVGAIENCRLLWARARAPLLKYVLDDDIMLPYALTTLVSLADKYPSASYYFGHRYIMDEIGRIIGEPKLIAEGASARLGRERIAQITLPRLENRIGEFSNILINAEAHIVPEAFSHYAGVSMEVMGDVAFYLNAAGVSPAVGVGVTVGGFRRHAQQQSSHTWNPRFGKGVCEWELFVRGEFQGGFLSQEDALAAVDRLREIYRLSTNRFPELRPLQSSLDSFREKVVQGRREAFDEDFRARWAQVDELVRGRVAAST